MSYVNVAVESAQNETFHSDGSISSIITRRKSLRLSTYLPSNPSPFELLPNEIVLEVMSYLDLPSLKNACLVDKRFHNLVTRSRSTMNKMPMRVGKFSGAENHAIDRFIRQYRVVNFVEVHKCFRYQKTALAKIGVDVATVTFQNCFLSSQELSEFLSCFPNIEKFEITDDLSLAVNFRFPAVAADQTMFPKLKSLKTQRVSLFPSHLFQWNHLQILQLHGGDWNLLEELLANQGEMQELTLYDCRNIPLNLELRPLNPNLKIFSLKFFTIEDLDARKFVQFLERFDNVITCLTVLFVDRVVDSHLIFDLIFTKFKSALGVAIHFDRLTDNEIFYRNVEVSPNLQSLVLMSSTLSNPVAFRQLFAKRPSIQNVSISLERIGRNMSDEDFKFMFDCLKNLKYFLLRATATAISRGVFKNITRLIVSTVTTEIDWEELSQSSPNIYKVAILTTNNQQTLNFKGLVKHLRNLTELEFGTGFKMLKKEMWLIKENALNLQHLILLETSWRLRKSPAETLHEMKLHYLKIRLLP